MTKYTMNAEEMLNASFEEITEELTPIFPSKEKLLSVAIGAFRVALLSRLGHRRGEHLIISFIVSPLHCPNCGENEILIDEDFFIMCPGCGSFNNSIYDFIPDLEDLSDSAEKEALFNVLFSEMPTLKIPLDKEGGEDAMLDSSSFISQAISQYKEVCKRCRPRPYYFVV